MEFVGVSSTDAVFSATVQGQGELDRLANNALQNGIDLYLSKDYKGAAKEFKRAIGLSQDSPYAVDAANYMAQSYLQLEDTESAIKSYKEAIRLDPNRDDTHVTLGNLYVSENRYEEAVQEYEEAVRINPNATNSYYLGQGYLNVERYSDAESLFNNVHRLEPDKPAGKHGLGMTYAQQGRYEDAIREFEDAIDIKDDFYGAYAEIGYAYSDMGEIDKALDIVHFLEVADEKALADALDRYMYVVDPPKMMFAHSYKSTFDYQTSVNTPVAKLDDYLANANASKQFSMVFQFDKDMDRLSVENPLNWKISRSTNTEPAKFYNFGLEIPSTEIYIAPLPDNIYYDADSMQATVKFTINQNDTADGTLHPSHIEFKFSGEDNYGNQMNEKFDQYTGFSGVA